MVRARQMTGRDVGCQISISWPGIMSSMPVIYVALVFLFKGVVMLLHNNFTMTECVQHGGFLFFMWALDQQVVFACIVKFPVDIMWTRTAIKCITWRTQVVQKQHSSVISVLSNTFHTLFAGLLGSHINMLELFGRGAGVFAKWPTDGWFHALATPGECWPQTEMFRFLLKRDFQPNNSRFCHTLCLTIDCICIVTRRFHSAVRWEPLCLQTAPNVCLSV